MGKEGTWVERKQVQADERSSLSYTCKEGESSLSTLRDKGKNRKKKRPADFRKWDKHTRAQTYEYLTCRAVMQPWRDFTLAILIER